MKHFNLQSKFKFTVTQKNVISEIVNRILEKRIKFQTLHGLTGTGKTFIMANIIDQLKMPTLVLSHNKTLAQQLYGELKKFFPKNYVHYYVSNFDFYQPEAYVPSQNLYIEKISQQNEQLEMLRSQALYSLSLHKDVIIVASVAAIYGQYDPNFLNSLSFKILLNMKISRIAFLKRINKIGYVRNDAKLSPGTYDASKGNIIEIMTLSNDKTYLKIDLWNNCVNKIIKINSLTKIQEDELNSYVLFPGKNYMYPEDLLQNAIENIQQDLNKRMNYFKKEKKLIELQRIHDRITKDLEDLKEYGYCSGMENYCMYFEKTSPPSTLLNYFFNDWLFIVDESHITWTQIDGMYNANYSRKQKLIDYGFRLPSSYENRPLKLNELKQKIKHCLFVSATPGREEKKLSINNISNQIIRPTGLLEPEIFIHAKDNQIFKIYKIIDEAIIKNERVMIITLTKKSSEEITEHLQQKNYKVNYIHSELKTLERSIVINALRKKHIDIIVGVNLLREGLDIPEAAVLIILDADVEGYLRNETSLLQMFGRVSRNSNGRVYLFVDKITKSIKNAISITKKRRLVQKKYNKENNIIPTTIKKPIIDIPGEQNYNLFNFKKFHSLKNQKVKQKLINEIKIKMLDASKQFDYDEASKYRNILLELDSEILNKI